MCDAYFLRVRAVECRGRSFFSFIWIFEVSIFTVRRVADSSHLGAKWLVTHHFTFSKSFHWRPSPPYHKGTHWLEGLSMFFQTSLRLSEAHLTILLVVLMLLVIAIVAVLLACFVHGLDKALPWPIWTFLLDCRVWLWTPGADGSKPGPESGGGSLILFASSLKSVSFPLLFAHWFWIYLARVAPGTCRLRLPSRTWKLRPVWVVEKR